MQRKHRILISLLILIFLLIFPFKKVFAYNPMTIENNKFGIHILFPEEITDAAKLVNSSGGDWGYVTIPIQASDKNLVKWQKFMDDAERLHLIPIIRLATNGDYFNTKVWEKPDYTAVLDFANFLNSLDWPTENRYVVIFNEVNRGDEWGGNTSPSEYASILSYAVSVFKSKNPNFYIISSGMDNAAQNAGSQSMNEYSFMNAMNQSDPGVFSRIDGIASHSYPNPGFKQSPNDPTTENIYSFKYEKQLADRLANKNLPVFITETGWSASELPDSSIASYLRVAFENAWSDNNIIAVTPFLLKAGGDPFSQFSISSLSDPQTERYLSIQKYPKNKGNPVIMNIKKVLGIETQKLNIPAKKFPEIPQKINYGLGLTMSKSALKWILNL